MKTYTGIKTETVNGLIVVYSDKYNEDYNYRNKINEKLIKHIKR